MNAFQADNLSATHPLTQAAFSRKTRDNGELMKTNRSRRAGFTLVELMTVVGIMGMLITLAVPNLLRARSGSQERICITNLNKIEWAKQMWGLENAKSLNDAPSESDLIGPSAYLRNDAFCPSGGSYGLNALKDPATCTTPGHSL